MILGSRTTYSHSPVRNLARSTLSWPVYSICFFLFTYVLNYVSIIAIFILNYYETFFKEIEGEKVSKRQRKERIIKRFGLKIEKYKIKTPFCFTDFSAMLFSKRGCFILSRVMALYFLA